MVLAYIMQKMALTLQEAIVMVKKLKPDIG
jgi:hypothetical protein